MTSREKNLSRVLASTLGVAAALAVAETACRLPRATPWGRPGVTRFYLDTRDLPGLEPEAVVTVNALGVRGALPLPPRERAVLCVGGSTTECLYVGDGLTWPDLLGATNAGRRSLSTPHHLRLLDAWPEAERFGTVIVLAGINDLGAAIRARRDPTFWAARFAPDRVDRETLPRWCDEERGSALLRRLEALVHPFHRGETCLPQWDPARTSREHRALRASLPRLPLPSGLDAEAAAYRERLADLAKLCRSRSQRLVTQPTLWECGTDADERLLLEHEEGGAVARADLASTLRRWNATMVEVARAEGVALVDLTTRAERSWFYDDCHFNVLGCRAVASLIRPALGG